MLAELLLDLLPEADTEMLVEAFKSQDRPTWDRYPLAH